MSTGFPHDPFHLIVNVQWAAGWDYLILYTQWFSVQVTDPVSVNMFGTTTWRLTNPLRVQEVGIERSELFAGQFPDGPQLDRSDPPSEHITWTESGEGTPGTVLQYPNSPHYLYHTGTASFFPSEGEFDVPPLHEFAGEWVHVNLKKIREDFREQLAEDDPIIELTGKFAFQNRPERAGDILEVRFSAYKLNNGTPQHAQYGTFEQEGFLIRTTGATKFDRTSAFIVVTDANLNAYLDLGTLEVESEIMFEEA